MGKNIFSRFGEVAAGEAGRALWAARAPYRPDARFDLMLIPRLPVGVDWREDTAARGGLPRIEAGAWGGSLSPGGGKGTVRPAGGGVGQGGGAIRSRTR